MSIPEIETIFVDWSRTLSVSQFWGHWKHPEDPQCEEHRLFERLQVIWRTENDSLLVPWMRGSLDAERVCSLVADDMGSDPGALLEGLIQSSRDMQLISPLIPDLVRQLRDAGARVVIATDNMDAFTRWTVPALHLDECFDDILNSANLGYLKNDLGADRKPGFFANYLTDHGLDARKALLIDDSLSTGQLVTELGMRFVPVTAEAPVVDALRQVLSAVPTWSRRQAAE